MLHEISTHNLADQIFDQVICPSGDTFQEMKHWLQVTRGLAVLLARTQRRPVAEALDPEQIAALEQAFVKAEKISHLLARVA
ncbi:MAG TPA: hypothetical protein PLY96_11275 [Chromatiaceae bacterium]|nr:hypothetical protein [Chromatiaceae bacterium]